MDILEHIQELYPTLTKKQKTFIKTIANYEVGVYNGAMLRN